MDRSIVFKLVGIVYTSDAIGQKIPTKTERTVYGLLRSITRDEWNAAGERGHNPTFRVDMFKGDYGGERECVIDGETYAVYRTYDSSSDRIELYIERKVGSE